MGWCHFVSVQLTFIEHCSPFPTAQKWIPFPFEWNGMEQNGNDRFYASYCNQAHYTHEDGSTYHNWLIFYLYIHTYIYVYIYVIARGQGYMAVNRPSEGAARGQGLFTLL